MRGQEQGRIVRAIRFHETGGPDVLRLEEVRRPHPKAGQVVIDVATAGVNRTDIQLRCGALPMPTAFPVIPGSEVAGTVADVGAGVDSSLIGTRVAALSHTGMGGYAEQLATSARFIVPMPDGLEFDKAAAVAAQGTTAVGLLASARLQPGESVLVEAATGDVGSLLVQLAKQRGATVIATARGRARVALAHSLGADIAVDHTEPDWDRQVRNAFDGDNLDVVLETIGGATARAAFDLLAPGSGRMVLYGRASWRWRDALPSDLFHRGVTLTALGADVWRRPGYARATLERALHLAARGRLKPMIGARYPLAEAVSAHEFLEDPATAGKTLLQV